mmetsp:Transcript_4252/g.11587  ORF Transcript_4252/g.11587 Transcript_4252/m.11587 type:complete len:408 (-) Transcript_4252:616-1839(-)
MNLIWVTVAALQGTAVLLRFDGSLKRPSDPGFPTPSLGQIAACAASIQDNDDGFSGNHHQCLGGKVVPVGTLACSTSAEAEYHGLLLGLEFLTNRLVVGDDDSPRVTKQQHSISPRPALLVSGDCKMVIDQLLGKSRPRKMEQHYLQAQSLLEQISPNFDTIRYQHIPRDQNELCDRLCANVIRKEEEHAVEQLEKCILKFSHHRRQLVPTRGNDEWSEMPLSDAHSSLPEIIQSHLQSPQSLIPYSKRPFYYQQLASIARKSSDYKTLIHIGKALQWEAKAIWSKAFHGAASPIASGSGTFDEPSSAGTCAPQLEAQGVRHEIDGLLAMGKEKEARHLGRKYSVLLQSVPQRLTDDGRAAASHGEPSGRDFPKLVQQWGNEREKRLAVAQSTNARLEPFWLSLSSR